MAETTHTPFSKVYDYFLSQITDDMYMEFTREDTENMLEDLLMAAIPWFEFPKIALDYTQSEYEVVTQGEPPQLITPGYFEYELTNEEINILAVYMITIWIGYQLASVENIRMKFSGSDFKLTSQANHMQKLLQLQKDYQRKGFHLQRLYSRRTKDSKGRYRPTFHNIMGPPKSYEKGKYQEEA